MNLDGHKILIVRPKPIAGLGHDQFIEQLQAAGAEPLHCPVMAIEPLAMPDAVFDAVSVMTPGDNPVLIKNRIADLANYSKAIFVSRPAACLGAQWINRCVPQFPVTTICYAVGDSTAEVLAGQGINAITPQQSLNSEGLLALQDLQQLDGQKVLVFRGCGGRDLLLDTLRQRGAEVHCVELYKRKQVDDYQLQISAALQTGVNAVAVHSGELLQALLQVVPDLLHSKLLSTKLLVPGQRVQQMAQKIGFKDIVVSNSALPQDMVSALR